MAEYSKKQAIVYGIIFIAFFVIAFNIPYCHDEWRWGIDEHLQLFYNGFIGYNGRLFGNILALIITRSNILKSFIISAFLTLFVRMCQLLCVNYKEDYFTPCITIAALLLMPNSLFQQIIGWPAAFVNFFPPVVMCMAAVYLLRSLIYDEQYTSGRRTYIYLFLLGLAMELFSENNTVYGLIFSVFVMFYGFSKEKKLNRDWVFMFAGTVTGFLIMFLNPAYRNAAAGTDGYKEIGIRGEESFISFVWTKYKSMGEMLFTDNTAIVIIICLLMLVLIIKEIKSSDNHKILNYLSLIFVSATILYMLCVTPYIRESINIFGEKYNKINFICSIGFFACALWCFAVMTEGARRKKLLLYTVSIPVVVCPLVMAFPIGPRCFITSYCFMILIALELMECAGITEMKAAKYFKPAAAICAGLLLAYYSGVFIKVGADYRVWKSDMEYVSQTGGKELYLKRLPYAQYFWTTEPADEEWEGYFREFYNIDENVEIVFFD